MSNSNSRASGDSPASDLPSLDRLRTSLNALNARRRIFPIQEAPSSAAALATALGIALGDVVTISLMDADGDELAVLVSGAVRLSLARVSEKVGATRVRLLGPRETRRRIGRLVGATGEVSAGPLSWWEVPFLTGLPAVVDSGLLSRDRLCLPTGEPLWAVRLSAEELVRVTNAHVGSIAGGASSATEREAGR